MGPSGGRSRARKACHWKLTAPQWEAIACICALRSMNFDVSRQALNCACGCQSCVCPRNEFSFSTTKCMFYRFSEHGGCRRMPWWMQTCERASMLRETMKETRCTSTLHPQAFGPRNLIRPCLFQILTNSQLVLHVEPRVIKPLRSRLPFSKVARIVWFPAWVPRYSGPLKDLPISPSGMFKLYIYLN